MVAMTSIVTTPKPRYQRRKKPAKPAPIESRWSDDADVDVPGASMSSSSG
jgi:hypothetical protein